MDGSIAWLSVRRGNGGARIFFDAAMGAGRERARGVSRVELVMATPTRAE
ncbi:MAG TPA: hypothetical protein VIV60_06040 [Polyangiaceae bacterium]